MSKPKTAAQIKKQIDWLKKNRDKVRHYTMFGDDNHAKIDAEIEVLESDLSEDDIYDRSADEGEEQGDKEWNWTQKEAALSVRHWMDGEDNEAEPIKNWTPLCN